MSQWYQENRSRSPNESLWIGSLNMIIQHASKNDYIAKSGIVYLQSY